MSLKSPTFHDRPLRQGSKRSISLLNNLLTLICVILTCCYPQKAYEQSVYFRHYQVEDGLSNNTVFCSVLDRHGFLWLGTKDGLDCFNGYTFKEYRMEDSLKVQGDSYIRSLYLDTTAERDILYIGTRIGIFKFDPLQESIEFILKTNAVVEGLVTDKAGRLWVVAGKQLLCLDLKTLQTIPVNTSKLAPVTAICKTPDEAVWLAGARGRIHKLRLDSLGQQLHMDDYEIFKVREHANATWMERIYAMRNGGILIGTSNLGAKLFDPETGRVKSLITYNHERVGIFARDFQEVGDSTLWIGTESGVYIYNLLTDHFEHLTQKTGDSYSLSDNAVYSLTVDREGGVWAGTYSGGLNYAPHPYSSFEKYYSGQGGKSALYGNVVREVCQDKYGNLWIGTEDGGLNELNPVTGHIRQYMASNKPTDISYPNIHALLAFGDTMLIGTFEHGMDIFNLKTDKVIGHFPEKTSTPGKRSVLKSNFIVTLGRTREGVIYVGTRLGLYRFYPHKNSLGNYFEPFIPQLSGSFVHTLMVDSRDRLWIGTMGSGLFCYDQQTGLVKNFVHEENNLHSISNNWITTTFEDRQGSIWVGTEGAGLCRLSSGDAVRFTRYTVADGFPGNTIYKVLQDDSGALWISTSRGLVRWDLSKDKLEVYTTANGLLSDQFNYNAGFRDQSGRLYFGSVKGLIGFDPESFTHSAFKAPLYITAVMAEGKEVATWNTLLNNKLLQDSNQDRGPNYIEIPHKQSSLTIEFAALSYTAPEMIQYQYKLEGLDNKWTYLSRNRRVYFTNLSPGSYTFKLKSTNISGKWNDHETLLYFKILPSFWESNLAITIYIMVALVIILFLFRSYHDRVKEKNKRIVENLAYTKEKELYEAKIDFFTHVTHEIKTPLTLIMAPLEKITQHIEEYPKFQKHIRMIQRNTTRLIKLSEQLLDFRKAGVTGFELHKEKVDLKSLLKELSQDFKALAKEKDLRFKMRLPDEPVFLQADKEAITKILSNLLNNASKYADSFIESGLKYGDDNHQQVIFYTINDGPTLTEDDKERIFEPFFRMDTAKRSSGAGLGLALCRTLVELHGGTLRLDTSIPQLNKFVLCLPVN